MFTDTLLRCTAPLFWAFFFLTGCALFVLRVRDPLRPRPFRVPLYPVLPVIFCITCLYMLYAAIDYAGPLSLIGVAVALLGVPLYLLSRRRPRLTRLRTVPGDGSDPYQRGATP